MISKNIFVGSCFIGSLQFYTYLFNDEIGDVGLGLFINDREYPLYYIINTKTNKVHISLDEQQFFEICKQSKFSVSERRGIFQEFMKYMQEMEHLGAKLMFKNEKIKYLSSSREMLKYKRIYIHYNELKGDFTAILQQ
ncbi:hypothetical protein ACFRAE_16895 [Sphingobacterium sp. HJSM2_6]|uniref:hypothetical protein n=1 Tax=Sphingobacterium sp. HJSM2_6 TaxID=3366264 RepID=UPI003BE0618E